MLSRIAGARGRLTEAEDTLRDDTTIRISLPGTAVPAGQTVLTVTGLDQPWAPWHAAEAERVAATGANRAVDSGADDSGADGGLDGDAARLAELIVRGPERIALTGPNGAGKTTLVRALAGLLAADGTETGAADPALVTGLNGVSVRRNAPHGYLPQRLDILDEALTVVENVRAVAPRAPVNAVRAGLARFLFRGARADQVAGTLSGGERFRAVLAALLLADPPPRLLLLDEPTNNLDLASVRQLSEALSCYQGALLVISHDLPFLRELSITRWLRLERSGRLTDAEPPGC
jgi:ATPase subunit of ABC transporter with duplicated ATPase domains